MSKAFSPYFVFMSEMGEESFATDWTKKKSNFATLPINLLSFNFKLGVLLKQLSKVVYESTTVLIYTFFPHLSFIFYNIICHYTLKDSALWYFFCLKINVLNVVANVLVLRYLKTEV